jgi:outer membrane protein W
MKTRIWQSTPLVFATLFALTWGAEVAQAQTDSTATRITSEIEADAKRIRNGAGLRVGSWSLQGHTTPGGATESHTAHLEGYFAKGIDLHLALENSVSFWRLTQKSTTSGGVLGGGTSTQVVNSYIIPQLTAIRVHPFTRPTDTIEPYLLAGVGITLGVEDRSGDSGGIFGVGGSSGTSFNMGIGGAGGVGVEWHATQAFGLAAGVRYKYVKFLNGSLGGNDVYKGYGFQGGLTYRFQYR